MLTLLHESLILALLVCADDCGSNINDYCSLDPTGGKPVGQMTLGEKEQAFLEAMSVSLEVMAFCSCMLADLSSFI